MRLSFFSSYLYQDPGLEVATTVSRLSSDRPIKSHPCSRFNRSGRVGIVLSNYRLTDRRSLHMDLPLRDLIVLDFQIENSHIRGTSQPLMPSARVRP